jgi:hypothetical protein
MRNASACRLLYLCKTTPKDFAASSALRDLDQGKHSASRCRQPKRFPGSARMNRYLLTAAETAARLAVYESTVVHSAEHDIITRPPTTRTRTSQPVRPAPQGLPMTGVCYRKEATPATPVKAYKVGRASVLRFGWFQVEMKRLSGTESGLNVRSPLSLNSVPGAERQMPGPRHPVFSAKLAMLAPFLSIEEQDPRLHHLCPKLPVP